MARSGGRSAAHTALLIVAPLVLLAYAGVGGWLWWADQQSPSEPAPQAGPVTSETGSEEAARAEPEEPAPASTPEQPSDPAPEAENPSETAGKADKEPPESHEPPKPHLPEPKEEPATGTNVVGRQDNGHGATPDESDSAPQPPAVPEIPPGHAEAAEEPAAAPEPEPTPPVTEPDPVPETAPETAAMPSPQAPSVSRPAPLPASSPLKPAPDPALVIKGRYGPLPIRADDGREAWQTYGRPFRRSASSRVIAIVVTELGLSEPATLSAIQDLPGEVTLAFTPYSRRLEEWVPAARAAGHEVLLQVPMEPRNLELNDPGDKALLTTNSPELNLDRLEWVMSRATGYVGLTSFMGNRMTVSEKDMRPILDVIGARGLAYVDPRVTRVSIAGKLAKELGVPAASGDRFIDQQAARDPIDQRLAQLEQIALSRGAAVGFAQAYPVTIERLRAWIPEMRKRGFELAPVTAVVSR